MSTVLHLGICFTLNGKGEGRNGRDRRGWERDCPTVISESLRLCTRESLLVWLSVLYNCVVFISNIKDVLALQNQTTKVQQMWTRRKHGEMTERDLTRLPRGLCASHLDYDTEYMHQLIWLMGDCGWLWSQLPWNKSALWSKWTKWWICMDFLYKRLQTWWILVKNTWKFVEDNHLWFLKIYLLFSYGKVNCHCMLFRNSFCCLLPSLCLEIDTTLNNDYEMLSLNSVALATETEAKFLLKCDFVAGETRQS